MSLTHTLQSLTRQAFRSLNGTLLPGVWMHRPLPTYDAATGDVLSAGAALYEVQCLLSQYSRAEVDGVRVLAQDRKLCIPQATLPVIPSVRDRIDVQGTIWEIIALAQDAAALTWQCQARAQGEGA